MGELVQFKKPRKQGIKGAARRQLTDAVNHVGSPVAVVIYTQNAEGVFAVRTVHLDTMHMFDVLSRAEAAIAADKPSFMGLDEAERDHER